MSFLFKFAVLIRYIGEMTQKEFEHIAGQMHSKALHVARIYVPLEADAEDVAGDVMLKLWAMHEKVPPDDKVEHLVGILTRNRAIDLLRTQKQERSLNESYEYWNNGSNAKSTVCRPLMLSSCECDRWNIVNSKR